MGLSMTDNEIYLCSMNGKRTYTLAEVFPDLVSKEKTIALRAYRTREDLTQRETGLTAVKTT